MVECSKDFAADQFTVLLKVAKLRSYDRIKLKPDAKLTIFDIPKKKNKKKKKQKNGKRTFIR